MSNTKPKASRPPKKNLKKLEAELTSSKAKVFNFVAKWIVPSVTVGVVGLFTYAKVSSEVGKLVLAQFEDPQIATTIEKAELDVFNHDLRPAIETAKADIGAKQEKIAAEQAAVEKQLDETKELVKFTALTLAAEGGDALAFDEIVGIAESEPGDTNQSQRSKHAKQTRDQIRFQHGQPAQSYSANFLVRAFANGQSGDVRSLRSPYDESTLKQVLTQDPIDGERKGTCDMLMVTASDPRVSHWPPEARESLPTEVTRKAMVPALVQAAKTDESAMVREACARALTAISGDYVEALNTRAINEWMEKHRDEYP